LTAATTTTGGDALGLANPEGATLYITGLILDITTEATGAANVNAGIAAAATTTSDTLIDGVDVGSAAIVANSEKHAGTNGMGMVKWTSSQFLTVTPSATLAGLVGTYHVTYIRA
jgi:hypothetical protein